MNVVILSRNPELYSTRRLQEAAHAAGHSVRVIDTLRCVLDIRAGQPALLVEGHRLENVDAVIPRIGASVTHYGLAVIRQFEAMGVTCLVGSDALVRSRDKLHCLQRLAADGLPIPRTSHAADPESHLVLSELVGGTPLVIKLPESSLGKGVVLAETPAVSDAMMDTLRSLSADFIVQDFIAEAAGTDLRCFVIGDRVVAAMQRQAAQGEFRSNLHKGGKATPVELSEQERRTAIAAARSVGLPVAGVDLLRARGGPVVMEVNSSPGLEGIESATGENIAAAIMACLESLHAGRTPRRTG